MVKTESYAQVAEGLSELHNRLRRLQNQMLREVHISLSEFHILLLLAHRETVSQNDLAEALDVDKALISRLTQAMVEKGLLQCRTDPDCRRRKLLSLGAGADKLLPKLQDVHRQSLEHLFASLEEQQLDTLQTILKGLVETL